MEEIINKYIIKDISKIIVEYTKDIYSEEQIYNILVKDKRKQIKLMVENELPRESLINFLNKGLLKGESLDFFTYGYIRNHLEMKDKLKIYIRYHSPHKGFYDDTYYNPYH